MKNIVLIVCDQMRGDSMGYIGHPFVKTPYLDTLMSSNAVTFENAYTACPSCVPSRASLLTGMSPAQNGRVGYKDGVPWEFTDTIAEVFRNNGYQTAALGKMHSYPIRKHFGFEILKLHDGFIGFHRKANIPYHEHQRNSDDYITNLVEKAGRNADINTNGLENNSWVASPWNYEESLHPTNWVVDETIEFLNKRDRTRPFFIMPSFVRPHPPFDAPQKYFDMYDPNVDYYNYAKDNWSESEMTEEFGQIMDSMHGCSDPKQRNEAMRGYFACITHMDHQISRIITALETDGSYEDTLILFTSDHGEMLFEHDLFRKSLPYEGSANVPFILRVGNNIKKIKTHKTDTVVALHDIMPTLLDFCDIEIPKQVDGVSLKDYVMEDTPIERDYIHGEHEYGKYSNQYIITNEYKYIWFSQDGREQLFDMKNDRKELVNLSDDPNSQTVLTEYRNILIKELEGREEGYSDGENLVVGCKAKLVLDSPGYLNT